MELNKKLSLMYISENTEIQDIVIITITKNKKIHSNINKKILLGNEQMLQCYPQCEVNPF